MVQLITPLASHKAGTNCTYVLPGRNVTPRWGEYVLIGTIHYYY